MYLMEMNKMENIDDSPIHVTKISNTIANIKAICNNGFIFNQSLYIGNNYMCYNIANSIFDIMQMHNIFNGNIKFDEFSEIDVININEILKLMSDNKMLSNDLEELKNKHEKLINQIRHIQEHFKEMEINKISDIKVYMDINTKEFEETLNKINNFNIQMADIKKLHE